MCRLRQKWLASRLQPEYRFIRTLQSPHHVVLDKRLGRYRISSKAFGPSSTDQTLSGDLEQVLLQDGLSATAMYPAVSDPVGAASITIGQLRAASASVSVDHDPTCSNWYHGAVTGTKPQGIRNKLLDHVLEIIPIDQERAKAFAEAHQARQNSPSA
jgi:hypothetical protein